MYIVIITFIGQSLTRKRRAVRVERESDMDDDGIDLEERDEDAIGVAVINTHHTTRHSTTIYTVMHMGMCDVFTRMYKCFKVHLCTYIVHACTFIHTFLLLTQEHMHV